MLPLDIHIEGQQVEILPEWRAKIEEEFGRLQKHYCGPILHARVEVIGTAHHHLGTVEIHLVVNVPGDIITIKQQGEIVLLVLVEAFHALDRRLSEHCQIAQQKVKAHEEFTHQGRILRLFPEYGFIGTDDGVEVYFHANAVKKGSFAKLNAGMMVKFGQEDGREGPQATWVQPV